MPDPVTAAVVGEKLLENIVIKGSASIFDQAQRWYRSYDLLILGQERAGKTALYKFLRSRLLSRDGENTVPTVDAQNTGLFSFEWKTEQGTLLLEFRNVGDRSGQIGPSEHAKLFVVKKPHFLVIVLDITTPEQSDQLNSAWGTWFRYFCVYVEDELRNRPGRARRLSSRLHSLTILLNKVDAVDPANVQSVVDHARVRLRAELAHLRPNFGSKIDSFQIIPCSIVENPRNGALEDSSLRLKELVRRLVDSTLAH
jgi:hypothetical protein